MTCDEFQDCVRRIFRLTNSEKVAAIRHARGCEACIKDVIERTDRYARNAPLGALQADATGKALAMELKFAVQNDPELRS